MRTLVAGRLLCLLLLSMLWTSCGSTQPSRFYLLTANDGVARSANGDAPSLGVGPINFPAYLDRAEVVVRRGSELEILAFERWAEPLPSHFLTVLVENLTQRTGSDRIYSFRWPGSITFDRRLTGSVSRFEVDASGEAVLSIQWRIVDPDGAAVVETRRSSFTTPTSGDGYAAMAAALSRTLADFSDEIAQTLAGL